jgi:hypothetical protein
MTFIEIGIARSAVALCDRSHAILPESVDFSSRGPFAPRFESGITYRTEIMVPNAADANGIPRHSSLRGNCSA